MGHDEFDAQKTLNNQNVQHGHWIFDKLKLWVSRKQILIILIVGILSLTIFNRYMFSRLSNYVSISRQISSNIPLTSTINQSFASLPSPDSKYVNTSIFIEKSDLIYNPDSYIDEEHNIIVRYRAEWLVDALYDKTIVSEKNFNIVSKATSQPSNIFINAQRTMVKPDPTSDATPQNFKFLTLFSSESTEVPPLPSSATSDYILKPILVFRYPMSTDPNRVWYLFESAEPLYTVGRVYTSENIRVILRDIILGIDLAQKEGYFVKNFEKLEVFAKTSVPAGGSGEYEEITGGQIFDDGNFVEFEFLSADERENYVNNFRNFLKIKIVDVLLYYITGGQFSETPVDKVGPEIPDFYSIVNDFIASNVSTISELLDHPFMTDGPITNPDLYNGKPEGSDHTISTVN